MNKLLLLISLLSLWTTANAQQPPAVFGNQSSTLEALSLIIRIPNFPFPEANTNDYIAAVDGDDAAITLGWGYVGENFQGDNVGFLSLDPPPSGSVHLILYDSSTMVFHILRDDFDEPLLIPFIDAFGPEGTIPNDNFIDGYAIAFTNGGSIEGPGTPAMPGQSDFTTIVALLPVEYTYFNARPDGDKVQMAWETASETGNRHFIVERSSNARAYEAIGTVTAAGDSQQKREYTFTDSGPSAGTNYYRLRQVDFDGTNSLSSIIVVNMERGAGKEISVFPNPVVGNLFTVTLAGNWSEDANLVVLYDLNGRELQRWTGIFAGSQVLDIEKNLPAGLYQLITTDENSSKSIRMIVR